MCAHSSKVLHARHACDSQRARRHACVCAQRSAIGDVNVHVAPVAPMVISDDVLTSITLAPRTLVTEMRSALVLVRSTTCQRSWWPTVMFTECLHAPQVVSGFRYSG